MSQPFPQLSMDGWYGFFHLVSITLHDMFFRGAVRGPDNIPAAGPCIIASNHASYFDPGVVAAHTPRQIHFFARSTLWKPGFPAWWLDSLKVIPVDRDGGSDVKAARAVLKAMRENKVISMFPEGTRSPDGGLQPAKPGVGMFACRTGAPVVPARIFGAFEAFGRDGKIRPFTPISLVFGKPLWPADYDDPSKGKERYQHASDIIMSRIAALSPPAPPAVI